MICEQNMFVLQHDHFNQRIKRYFLEIRKATTKTRMIQKRFFYSFLSCKHAMYYHFLVTLIGRKTTIAVKTKR
jgi:hypothetical protein